MRTSTIQLYTQSINKMLERQTELADLEEKIASGQKLNKPSDDPVGSVRVINMSAELAAYDQYARNIDLARSQISQEESVLGQAGNALQRIRELLVQANNDTLDDSNRRAIATEIDSLNEDLMALANTKDATGEYLFGGFQAETQPFSRTGGVVQYNGDQGQRLVRIGTTAQVETRDNGFTVFQQVPSGNGQFTIDADGGNTGNAIMSGSLSGAFVPDDYTINFIQAVPTDPITYEVRDGTAALVQSGNYLDGQSIEFNGAKLRFDGTPDDGDVFNVSEAGRKDVFSTIQEIVDLLNTPAPDNATSAKLHTKMNNALESIDRATGHFLDVRAEIGVRLSRLDNQEDVNESAKLQVERSLSSIQDLDYGEAINQLNTKLFALEAAQQTYVRITQLSIFNYL